MRPPTYPIAAATTSRCDCAGALAVLFGLVTVIVNLADVTSDIVVAVEFYRKDRILWFWLVMSSLIVGSVVYAAFGAMVGARRGQVFGCLAQVPKALVFIILLPVAQFFPVAHFIFEKCSGRATSGDNSALHFAIYGLRDRAKTAGRASRQALLDVADDLEVQYNLSEAFSDHFQTYFPFYIESAVEALPQAAIQIVAVTYFNDATPAQVVSICLSLLSVLSKLVAILRSFDVRLTVFRVLCGAHDVFGACYILASVLAPSSGRHATFLGTAMTTLSLVWCCKCMLLALIYAVACIAIVIVKFNESPNWHHRRDVIVMLLLGIVAVGPGILTLECMKLSLFGWYALSKGPRGASPSYRLVAEFFLGSVDYGLPCELDVGPHSRVRSLYRSLGRTPTAPTEDPGNVPHPSPDYYQPGYLCSRGVDRMCSVALGVLQLISFTYPFINVGLYSGEQSVLQWIFFVGAVVTLVPAVALFPYAWRRYLVMELLHTRDLGVDVLTVATAISNYFAGADVALLLAKTVPSAVLPVEVLRYVVSGYLHSEDVDTSGLSGAELDAINHVEEGSGW